MYNTSWNYSKIPHKKIYINSFKKNIYIHPDHYIIKKFIDYQKMMINVTKEAFHATYTLHSL